MVLGIRTGDDGALGNTNVGLDYAYGYDYTHKDTTSFALEIFGKLCLLRIREIRKILHFHRTLKALFIPISFICSKRRR